MDHWPSELRTFKDEKTGHPITQLTCTGNNVHFYFTENSFDLNDNVIYFLSDRASGVSKAPHEDPSYNVFRMDLSTGEMEQISDDVLDGAGTATKTPDSTLLTYRTRNGQVKVFNTQTGKSTVLYEDVPGYEIASVPSIAPNQRYVAFCRNEITDEKVHYQGANYGGFKERFYMIKDGRITVAMLDGSGWFDIFKDTHQLGHFQFSPDDPTIGTFCHEGPWNLVNQRIWLFDFISREAKPCFRQNEIDSIGHEFWTQDGLVFFDDRGPGHDGTITSNRTQAVVTDVPVNQNAMIPFVGLMDRNGQLVRRIDMPFYCNHYHANPDNTILVGDDVDDLVLLDISGEKAELKTLCNHKTSWHTQSSHCHPTWSWDGNRILYASDFGGHVQIYLLEV
jgi:oligogalacturonide lyase